MGTEPLIRLPSVVYENIGKMKDDRWLGTDYAERMRYSLRHMDEVLTEILKNEYGKYLGYYPPVYVITKCLEVLRPYYLECGDETEFKKEWSFTNFFNNYGYLVENGQTEEQQNANEYNEYTEESLKPKKKQTSFFSRQKTEKAEDSPKTEKKKISRTESKGSPKTQKKSINWFFGSSKNDNEVKKVDNTESKIDKPKKEASAEMPDSIYYPFEDSDIDEDDESDVEGEYNFYKAHDPDFSDGGESIKSEKELTDAYEKELKIKLVENYVNGDTKDTKEKKKLSYKRSNSLKKLVNKFKK